VEALLEVVEDALDGLAARPHAADVGVMEDVGDEADEAPVVGEGGLDHEEVGKVSGAEEGAVEEHHVPGPEPVARERLDRILGGEGHRPHVSGAVGPLGDHPARGIEEADGEVLALAGLLGVRRPVHGRADLYRDRLERPPDHAQGDGIHAIHRVTGLT
jgi:hypothetical protein